MIELGICAGAFCKGRRGKKEIVFCYSSSCTFLVLSHMMLSRNYRYPSPMYTFRNVRYKPTAMSQLFDPALTSLAAVIPIFKNSCKENGNLWEGVAGNRYHAISEDYMRKNGVCSANERNRKDPPARMRSYCQITTFMPC